jgi:hypothetical protein
MAYVTYLTYNPLFLCQKSIMRYLVAVSSLFLSIQMAAQSVGINTPTPNSSAQLDIVSTTKGLLIPRMTQAQRLALVAPANGLMVFQTDGQPGLYYNTGTSVSPSWATAGGNNWSLGGNNLTATGSFGTTSNNHVDLITNNLVRGRLSDLGEFFIGATNTVVLGDLMGVVSNATFPFAVNGYSSFNGAGVYGSIQAGNTQFAAVQGEYQSSSAGIFNTAGVRGFNQSTVPGTGFRTQSSTGPRAGIIGSTASIGFGQYTFGVHGSMGSTDLRCGAVIGDDFGIALGVLAYYAANSADYSVYGFGRAYEIGAPTGRSSAPDGPNTHIGLGIYGGVMGGWMRGLVYGTHVKGERYSLYVDGKAYTNEPLAELVPNADGSRSPAYGLVAPQPEVYAKGKAQLQNGRLYVRFSEVFANMANPNDVVVTVSPLASSKGLYIAEQDAQGFLVKENGEGNGNIAFAWTAIGTRKGLATAHAPELLQKDFDTKMNGVLFNDNNTTDRPQPIWWDGQQVRFDAPPAKRVDAGYRPGVRQGGVTR